MRELRRKFHKTCELYYPGALYPEFAYLFDMVLGINAANVAAVPITKKTYTVNLRDADGNLTASVTRKFTPQQQKLVRQWWPLLPESMR